MTPSRRFRLIHCYLPCGLIFGVFLRLLLVVVVLLHTGCVTRAVPSERVVLLVRSVIMNPIETNQPGKVIMDYEHFYLLGRAAAVGGNFWLTSAPFTGWQGDAWKDGNFDYQQGTRK